MKITTRLLAITLLVYSAVSAANGYLSIPIFSLLVQPEQYLGKTVVVHGYMKGANLYYHEDAARLGDTPSSIGLVNPSLEGEMYSNCNKRYVVVFGVIVKEEGRYYLGGIDKVTESESLKVCWTRNS